MSRLLRFIVPLLLVLLICTSVAYAQDEDIDGMIKTVAGAPSTVMVGMKTFMWIMMYLPIYAAALVVTLSYLRLFNGFDTDVLIWITVLWLGGIVMSYASHHLIHGHVGAVLLSLPLLFGWGMLVNTRAFADLTVKDAWRVALVVTLVCAPWFGSWSLRRPVNPAMQMESRLVVPATPPALHVVEG